MAVFSSEADLDTWIKRDISIQNRTYARVRRSVVCNAQLPMGINLGTHGVDCFGQKLRVWIVGGHQYRNDRLLRELVRTCRQARSPGGCQVVVLLKPLG